MNITPQTYQKMSKRAEPKSNTKANVAAAFLAGGGICVLGQLLLSAFTYAGMDKIEAGTWTSMILVMLSAVFTGVGLYEKLAKYAGAGTLVPITGFSNAISSSAIEAKSEGWVLGVGAKIFTIAGPVILYGTSAALVYGILYYIVTSFM